MSKKQKESSVKSRRQLEHQDRAEYGQEVIKICLDFTKEVDGCVKSRRKKAGG